MKSSLSSTFIILLVSSISLFSCNDESSEPAVIQLLINSSAEAGNQLPNRWFFQNGDCETEWSSDHFFTGEKSLKISTDNDVGDFGYWGQTVRTDIPYGQRLRLSAMIKLENVDTDNSGVSLVIRGDDESSQVFFYSTYGDIPIRGNQDWSKYSIDMKSPIPENVTSILVFLVLGSDTKGTAYFDDITLETIN